MKKQFVKHSTNSDMGGFLPGYWYGWTVFLQTHWGFRGTGSPTGVFGTPRQRRMRGGGSSTEAPGEKGAGTPSGSCQDCR